MNDRRLGYFLLACICIAVAVAGTYVVRTLFLPPPSLVLAFDRIGAIRLEDPLKLDGVDIGSISRIEPRESSVFVTVDLHTAIDIHQGYRIQSRDQGILGARVLEIENGPPNAPRVELSDTLRAAFTPGVSEAVGQAYKLKNLVDSYVRAADRLLYGTPDSPSFVDGFDSLVRTTDVLTRKLTRGSALIAQTLDTQLRGLDTLITATSEIATLASHKAPSTLSAIDSHLVAALGLCQSLNGVLDTMESSMERVRTADSAISPRLDSLHAAIREARGALDTISSEGLRLKLNLFGR
jgi:phospholipid/cholesterol/gamma-HCH transport system substrate-binding protein